MGVAFIPNLIGGGDLYPLNSPCWSLLDELLANLAYGAIARTLAERLLKILVCLGLAAVCIVTLRSGISANLGVSATNWIGGIARASFSFPLGILLHRLYLRGRLPRLRVPVWILLAIAVGSFCVPSQEPLYDLLAIALIYPALIVASLANEPRSKTADTIFGLAGFVSYPLYVLDYPPARLLQVFMPNDGFVGALLGLAVMVGSILFAYLAAKYFDLPLQAWLRRRPVRPAAVSRRELRIKVKDGKSLPAALAKWRRSIL